VGEDSTDEASVSVSREPWEEARERVDTLRSESSAEDWPRELEDETFLIAAMSMVARSGALYESMLVVDTRATGREICERSMFTGFRTLWLRVGDTGPSFGPSDRLMRLVNVRASDILMF
jgi:hypothetical protein